MSHPTRRCRTSIFTAALLIVPLASAHGETIEGTVTRSAHNNGITIDERNTSEFQLSQNAKHFLNATNIQVEAIAPGSIEASRNAIDRYTSVTVNMPVSAITGLMATGTRPFGEYLIDDYSITGFNNSGGVRLVATDEAFTNSGGSLSITNLHIDLIDKQIYGDVEGDNGVNLIPQMLLWSFAQVSPGELYAADTWCTLGSPAICRTELAATNSVSGLQIYDQAFEVFTQALGLTSDGAHSLSMVTDYGVITTAVPEPASWLLMGLGLVGIGLARRRTTPH